MIKELSRSAQPGDSPDVEGLPGAGIKPGENEFRVFGPPGTGKTHWITEEVGREALAHGPERVMITSLTTAAARTIGSRNASIPEKNVGTLHAHCFSAIGGAIIAEMKRVEFNAAHPRFALSVDDGRAVDDAGEMSSEFSPGDELFGRYKLLRSAMIPRNRWTPQVVKFAQAWESWKEGRGYRDFTDLIEVAYRTNAIAPGDPAVIFVDEAQDHDALELALIRKWGRYAERLVIVGDPDQAIYEWRGADPHAFQTPPLPPSQRHELNQSYRIPSKVHSVATKWIRQIRDREPIAYRPKDFEGSVRRLHGNFRRPTPIVRDIQRQIGEGRECMVLAASSYMLDPMLREMRKQGIPYHNPYRKKAGHWNPLQPQTRGTTSTERLLSFLRPSAAAWPGKNRRWTYADLREWIPIIGSAGVLKHGAKAAITNTQSDRELTSHELLEHFEEEAVRKMIRLDLPWFRDHVQPARRAAIEFPVNVAMNSGHAALMAKPSVMVGTIHSFKGGECDTVYLMPDLSPVSAATWAASGRGRDSLIRLFYVGMTRAERELVLCDPAGRHRVSGINPGL